MMGKKLSESERNYRAFVKNERASKKSWMQGLAAISASDKKSRARSAPYKLGNERPER